MSFVMIHFILKVILPHGVCFFLRDEQVKTDFNIQTKQENQ
mgnify:CR=1 FL=1